MKVRVMAVMAVSIAALQLRPIAAAAQTPPLPPPPPIQVHTDPAAAEPPPSGSAYLRCDGHARVMSGMEVFGRVVALSLVVGLLIPMPEVDDPSKRQRGEKGVSACTELLDNPDSRENNKLRRIPLFLARAIHQIELKKYKEAIADIHFAREEARSLNLIGNPYFDRSMGLSINDLESEALRMSGDPVAAAEIGLRDVNRFPHSFYAVLTASPYASAIRQSSAAEDGYYRALDRLELNGVIYHTNRLMELGRFDDAAEAAETRLALAELSPTASKVPWPHVLAALAETLAGHWDKAEAQETLARSLMEAATAEAQPVQISDVEQLDLIEIARLAHNGRLEEARQRFSARSQWTAPPLGAVAAIGDQLRAGVPSSQWTGALATTTDALWAKRDALDQAQRLKTVERNNSLFSHILPYAPIGDYEAMSRQVWNVSNSRLISRTASEGFFMLSIDGAPTTQPDALMLHAALEAKARGYSGFIRTMERRKPEGAYVRFGNLGDPGMTNYNFIKADDVIAELRQIIPSPDELAARRQNN
jgi:hypothetical protein